MLECGPLCSRGPYCAQSGCVARQDLPVVTPVTITLLLWAGFTLACALAAILLFPGLRDGLARRAGLRWPAAPWSALRLNPGLAGLALPGWIWGAVLVLALLPPLLLSASGWRQSLGLGPAADTASDQRLSALLEGEQLVPPPPLPPEVFERAEREGLRPQLSTADRHWVLLDAEFRARLLLVFKRMREVHGYEMVLLEGYRSPERQAMLQALGPHVTHAGGYQSYHQAGLAADCAFLREGRIVISERDAWAQRGYELYGEEAERLGLRWGGAWTLRDFGHVELPRTGALKAAAAGR